MPIRAQCDNCGKVYNLPDENAGKRLRCKQCAVAFTVPNLAPAADAPTLGPQKICTVCGQNVAGRPRTKDQAGNYYCRPCYEEKARAREQLAQSRIGAAVPAGVGGGGGGGDDGEMIDLAALEPSEQFDESTQPPPPPIPDMDLVAPPLPDMQEPMLAEPVMLELPPKPKKKKKKKKSVAVQAASADSIIAKIVGLPLETWVIAAAVMMITAALVNNRLAPEAVGGLWLLGIGCAIWGHVCCVICAFSEDTTTGVRYLIFPFYQLFFILTNWSTVQRYVLRSGMGLAFIIIGVGISVKAIKDDFKQMGSRSAQARSSQPQNLSSDPAFKVVLDAEPPGEPEEQQAQEKAVADAILGSFKQRGVKPPEGEKYDVQATVTMGESATAKINVPLDDNGKKIKMRAPMLTCQLVVKNSAGSEVYNQSRPIVMAKDAYEKATPEQQDDEEYIDKLLWKDVAGQFKEMAGEVPLTPPSGTSGTATPAGATATPTDSPAPAK